MTANAGYHTYATGDVLTAAQVQYNLQNQTTMYFASASARTTALTGVLVEGMVSYIPANGIEYYNGSAWVSVSQAVTALTTKGDLLTYSTQDTRLPVGSDGQTLVANSSQTTGLAYTNNFAAGKNAIINGAFTVSQRGATFSSPTSGTYNVDRVLCAWDGTGATRTFSQQTQTPGAISGVETPYFYRWNQSVAGSSGTFNLMTTLLEGVQTFAGQSVTFSFYAKAASNLSLVAADINQNFGSGGSAAVTNTMTLSTTSVTTAWTRITAIVTLAAITGKTIGTGSSIQIRLWLPNNAAFTFDTVGWQLEAGSVATAFQTATGTLQGELAACQRYYWRTIPGGGNTEIGNGIAGSALAIGASVRLPVTMRTSPTTLDYASVRFDDTVNVITVTSLTLATTGTNADVAYINSVVAGATQYRPYFLSGNGSGFYLGLSAEL